MCDVGHRKRMWRPRENVLDKNVRKGHPVGKRERSTREQGERKTALSSASWKTGPPHKANEGRGSSSGRECLLQRRWMGKTGRLGKISMPRQGENEAEQCMPPWWMPHGPQDGPRTQSLFASTPPDGMTLWKILNLPNECVSISYPPGRFHMVSEW